MQSKNVVKLSAAGSGKTWGICTEAINLSENLSPNKKILIVTYTNKGIDSIKNEIKKNNYGVLHEKIIIKSWFQFLMSDLIKPYQNYITDINSIKSYDFTQTYGYKNFNKKGSKSRYINSKGFVLSNYASELATVLNEKTKGLVIDRLERIYSNIFIDEVQDLAGDDITIVNLLFYSKIHITCVGDNKQATYTTHNTRKFKKYTGENIWNFFIEKEKENLITIEKSLISRRFNKDICDFANKLFFNENNMITSMTVTTGHDGVFIIESKNVVDYIEYYSPIALKYDKRTKVHTDISYNFGQCKGCTFDRVLIYPNVPLKDFILKNKEIKSPAKYYVAVTRARYSMTFVVDKFPKNKVNFELEKLNLNDKTIDVLRIK